MSDTFTSWAGMLPSNIRFGENHPVKFSVWKFECFASVTFVREIDYRIAEETFASGVDI
jgi:hypothetical protein